MPLPLIIGIAAGIAAVGGLGSGIHGGVKMKNANDTMEAANRRQKENISKFETKNNRTTASMDKLGQAELNILSSFKDFSVLIERIKKRTVFENISIGDVKLPKYSAEEIEKASVGAAVLIGGLGGAAAGTAGGFAAAGATTAAVMAIGTASTGTAIASLSGVAATNATLAALGGGAIAAGGGGMALGSAVLGGATLGIGLLVGGVIFNITGSKLNDKADNAWEQMKETESTINKICEYLDNLNKSAKDYYDTIKQVQKLYESNLSKLKNIIENSNKHDWNDFTSQEKLITENTIRLVSLLYQMCKVQIVIKADNEDDINQINYKDIEESRKDAKIVTKYLQIV